MHAARPFRQALNASAPNRGAAKATLREAGAHRYAPHGGVDGCAVHAFNHRSKTTPA